MSVIKYGRTIPEFVKRLREEMEWTQKNLADEMGIHPQYVSNVERGISKNPLSFCTLLYEVVPKGRKQYLLDLIADHTSQAAVFRMRRKIKAKKLHA